jgi:tetratricopeptide (TPR) repeat protein
MARIFISYRRSETHMVAGRLRESLARVFGTGAIFRDKDSIAGGEDWTRAIDGGLTVRTVVLALLGPQWVDARNEQGQRRLDDKDDWNRREIAQALERGCLVIPLLVDGAMMPAASQLPEPLQPLVRLHALKLRDDDWEPDVDRLVRAIGRPARTWLIASAAAVVALAVGGASLGWWRSMAPGANPDDTAEPAQSSTDGGASDSGNGSGISLGEDALSRLDQQQRVAMALLDRDRPAAIAAIDRNLREVDIALKSFPDNAQLHALAGYAAKNAYANSKGLVDPSRREMYLTLAERHFRRALEVSHDDPSAINGLGNVRFYQHRFDEAITLHKRALLLTGNAYPDAQNDLQLVQLAKLGKVPVDP